MPLFKHTTEGRKIHVSGVEAEKQYAANPMWQLVTEKPAPEKPEGDPQDSWTVAQLTAWAEENDVEVPAGPKPVVVEAVLAALAERKAKAEADAKAAADATKN